MRLRVGTFNAENLFARFRFASHLSVEQVQAMLADGWQTDQTLFEAFDTERRQLTGAAIHAIDADILALQEIESLDTLKHFNRKFLETMGYRYPMLIDGNDSRGIDVALLSRFPFTYLQTHQFDAPPDRPDAPIFSRDCLEVGLALPTGSELVVFVNHFKCITGDRLGTTARRRAQAEQVARIVEARFPDPAAADFLILGDLNDYMPSPGLAPLLEKPWLENVVSRLPERERWTHHYAFADEYRQLDYILPSRRLADANPDSVPFIERRGLAQRAARATVRRFHGVGDDRPKASDHCPVVWEFTVPPR